MIANSVSHSPVSGIQELSFDEIDAVVGGNQAGLSQGANFAAGALGAIAGSAALLAVVPTPFSPVLGTFAVASAAAAGFFGFVGAVTAGGGSIRHPHVKHV